jgi:hypothetical protein
VLVTVDSGAVSLLKRHHQTIGVEGDPPIVVRVAKGSSIKTMLARVRESDVGVFAVEVSVLSIRGMISSRRSRNG